MTSQAVIKFLEEKEDEFGEDGDEFVKGLLLLEKYKPIKEIAAQHDIIYVAEFTKKITKEDVLQLHRWGFHLDEEEEFWAYFT